MNLNPVVADVTRRIVQRSQDTRAAYLANMENAVAAGPGRAKLSCANWAHAFAGQDPADKLRALDPNAPNIGIVTAYNDMLSAHQPLGVYPDLLKAAAREAGATAQVAGGVPAMCDGVTQGRPGMELSLFSRDVIAMGTGVALTHDAFDSALMLGVCDKIVPGLLMGALTFSHLPTIFVPAGPMTSGISNDEKAKVRALYAEGKVGREELLAAETAAYHGPGTCTFYGTANSNQMLMEMMGLHMPGSAFVHPNTPLREALTRAAAHRAAAITRHGNEWTPIGRMFDEKALVNGVVGLMATGGSTNLCLHLVAIAKCAGLVLTLEDLDALSQATPLIARVYPNGKGDVNQFHAAGGMAFVVRELLKAGLAHEDVLTVAGQGLSRYAQEPALIDGALSWRNGPSESLDPSMLRPVSAPFDKEGGIRVLNGGLGRAVSKISAVQAQDRRVRAPAAVFDDQEGFLDAFKRGALDRDFVAVVRFQGPGANGMPELHGLTPALTVLMGRGFKVALVTDGRMSGASGKIASAIHVTPEAAKGGALARVLDGDMITVDPENGVLEIEVDHAALLARPAAPAPAEAAGFGRELFGWMRRAVGPADAGASVF
jgi:phosphogluconate dehydratase